jgi:decaprenylphospho-beta-D-ribofuranose 2-oxidase
MKPAIAEPASSVLPNAVNDARPPSAVVAWGRVSTPGREVLGENFERNTLGARLSRGLGRSYGDSSLPAHPEDRVANSRLANRILSFDDATGVLRAEAGFSLVELNRIFMPRGWFSPVTPGTKYVTLGGMVASDVHGKNHHVEGCFGAHVRELKLRLADDSIVTCSPTQDADLFYGTIGGMGLLGHVLEVEFGLQRIPSSWIYMESERVRGVDEFLATLTRFAPLFSMTVGWIDCLTRGASMGRGIMMAGRWATAEEAAGLTLPSPRQAKFPIELPNWAINPLTVGLFNTVYYWKHMDFRQSTIVGPEPFFYPLDAVQEWNKVYGSRGFTQYQCVIPRAAGAPAVREFMQLLTELGGASPLCVIKDCGPEGKGTLSFPLEGTSVAVDMAIGADTQAIVDRLNEFVIACHGRIYLTKDLFTRPAHYRAMDPRVPAFLALREKWDPHRRIRSAQSARIFGDT